MMDNKRKATLAVMTVAVAGFTGHVMQNLAATDHPARNLSIATASDHRTEVLPFDVTEIAVADEQVAQGGPAFPPLEALPGRTLSTLEPGSSHGRPTVALMRQGSEAVTPDDPGELSAALPDVNPETLPEASPPLARMTLASRVEDVRAAPALNAVDRHADPVAEADPCEPVLTLAAAPAAMIDIALDVPCHPEARVRIRHGGLAVTGLTSESGALDLSLPALAVEAEVTIAVRSGPTVSRVVSVPEAADYDRVALQWQGEDSFQLNAYEFGAGHGAPGHVSATNPREPEAAIEAAGGFMTVLGDDSVDWPLLAEVYSFPSAQIEQEGSVEFVVEVAVTQRTCGREMLGEALEVFGGGSPRAIEITLPMPDCELAGGFLVLKNLLPDLKIAGN